MTPRDGRSRRYKWDNHTQTGYQLRYDAESAAKGGHFCWHVEDWTCHTVTNEWQCRNLDDALAVLGRLFDLDVADERVRLSDWEQTAPFAAAA